MGFQYRTTQIRAAKRNFRTLRTRESQQATNGVLNYSSVFDEVFDFEANIRNVSGPGNLTVVPLPPCSDPPPATSANDPKHGLLLGDKDPKLAPCVINAFLKPNENRNEITVTLPGSNVAVKALSALNEWVRIAIRTPNGPLTDAQIKGGISHEDVEEGRELFKKAGCASCHGRPASGTSSRPPL